MVAKRKLAKKPANEATNQKQKGQVKSTTNKHQIAPNSLTERNNDLLSRNQVYPITGHNNAFRKPLPRRLPKPPKANIPRKLHIRNPQPKCKPEQSNMTCVPPVKENKENNARANEHAPITFEHLIEPSSNDPYFDVRGVFNDTDIKDADIDNSSNASSAGNSVENIFAVKIPKKVKEKLETPAVVLDCVVNNTDVRSQQSESSIVSASSSEMKRKASMIKVEELENGITKCDEEVETEPMESGHVEENLKKEETISEKIENPKCDQEPLPANESSSPVNKMEVEAPTKVKTNDETFKAENKTKFHKAPEYSPDRSYSSSDESYTDEESYSSWTDDSYTDECYSSYTETDRSDSYSDESEHESTLSSETNESGGLPRRRRKREMRRRRASESDSESIESDVSGNEADIDETNLHEDCDYKKMEFISNESKSSDSQGSLSTDQLNAKPTGNSNTDQCNVFTMEQSKESDMEQTKSSDIEQVNSSYIEQPNKLQADKPEVPLTTNENSTRYPTKKFNEASDIEGSSTSPKKSSKVTSDNERTKVSVDQIKPSDTKQTEVSEIENIANSYNERPKVSEIEQAEASLTEQLPVSVTQKNKSAIGKAVNGKKHPFIPYERPPRFDRRQEKTTKLYNWRTNKVEIIRRGNGKYKDSVKDACANKPGSPRKRTIPIASSLNQTKKQTSKPAAETKIVPEVAETKTAKIPPASPKEPKLKSKQKNSKSRNDPSGLTADDVSHRITHTMKDMAKELERLNAEIRGSLVSLPKANDEVETPNITLKNDGEILDKIGNRDGKTANETAVDVEIPNGKLKLEGKTPKENLKHDVGMPKETENHDVKTPNDTVKRTNESRNQNAKQNVDNLNELVKCESSNENVKHGGISDNDNKKDNKKKSLKNEDKKLKRDQITDAISKKVNKTRENDNSNDKQMTSTKEDIKKETGLPQTAPVQNFVSEKTKRTLSRMERIRMALENPTRSPNAKSKGTHSGSIKSTNVTNENPESAQKSRVKADNGTNAKPVTQENNANEVNVNNAKSEAAEKSHTKSGKATNIAKVEPESTQKSSLKAVNLARGKPEKIQKSNTKSANVSPEAMQKSSGKVDSAITEKSGEIKNDSLEYASIEAQHGSDVSQVLEKATKTRMIDRIISALYDQNKDETKSQTAETKNEIQIDQDLVNIVDTVCDNDSVDGQDGETTLLTKKSIMSILDETFNEEDLLEKRNTDVNQQSHGGVKYDINNDVLMMQALTIQGTSKELTERIDQSYGVFKSHWSPDDDDKPFWKEYTNHVNNDQELLIMNEEPVPKSLSKENICAKDCYFDHGKKLHLRSPEATSCNVI